MLQTLLESAARLVFPSVCELCAAAVPPSCLGVCNQCLAKIQWIRAPYCVTCGRTVALDGLSCGECEKGPYGYNRAFACAWYNGAMKELIHTYKFKGRKSLQSFFSKIIGDFFDQNLSQQKFDATVSVPITSKKARERGFNQSALLSRALSKRIGLEDLSQSLRRLKSDSSQVPLSKTQRKINVEGCFTASQSVFLKKNLLLIDDILTTGQTASECAKTLKAAGATSVTLLAVARGM